MGNHSIVRCLSGLFLLAASVAPLRAADETLAEKFRREYPAAEERLENAYRRAKVSGIEVRDDNDGSLLWRQRFTFERHDDLMLSVKTVLESTSTRWAAGTSGAEGGSPDKFFYVFRAEADKAFTILWFGPNKTFFSDTSRMTCAPLFAPYCITDIRFNDFLAEPGMTVRAVSNDKLADQSVVRVDTRWTLPDGRINEGSTFLLRRTWAIAGWRVTIKEASAPTSFGLVLDGRVAYGDLNPMPKVDKVTCWREDPTGSGKKLSEQTFQVTSFEFVDVPPDQFQLKAFGIAEPSAPIIPKSEDAGK